MSECLVTNQLIADADSADVCTEKCILGFGKWSGVLPRNKLGIIWVSGLQAEHGLPETICPALRRYGFIFFPKAEYFVP